VLVLAHCDRQTSVYENVSTNESIADIIGGTVNRLAEIGNRSCQEQRLADIEGHDACPGGYGGEKRGLGGLE
jgi:hypothetical protein